MYFKNWEVYNFLQEIIEETTVEIIAGFVSN
jgi:hypothetical protein